MLLKRFTSAVIGILLLILIIFMGSIPFLALVLVTALIAVKEFNTILVLLSKKNQLFLSLLSLVIIIFTYINNKGVINIPWSYFILIMFLLLIVYHIKEIDNENFLNTLGYNLIGIVYLAGGLSFFILLREFSVAPFDNTKALWLALIATWAADTGAYFIGNKFGKTRLSPKSPNKSVEGAVGGIVFSTILIFIYTSIIGAFSIYWLFYAPLIAIIAMIGDLFESSIKRFANVKDSGELIPGHGGILDRIDSLLFSIPFTYLFIILF
ncbi:phosphatidate cytidylyltransferase [Natronospora cellulosivora (SeqCode)]